ncbi:hypothetical protein M427DRAFT_324157 [Gonapodya prolifera JEL478]|uniref:Uncharacterized protein n=1 Tax=Gonapodya prolifera (strain JEL478) TaxID=1344416 RepID=A0A139AFM9_GONPJ|nr:hypothetical protein M427DRAFT_324157 [Gonapodya prolifera JEL478]|eukprot:KXS15374.1 hypothetical protein M427DRAFT_324157 [Gonapodya prolifera JEL478]
MLSTPCRYWNSPHVLQCGGGEGTDCRDVGGTAFASKLAFDFTGGVFTRICVEAETNAAALQICNSALEQEVSTLRSRTSTLERDLESLKHDIAALMQAAATLRQENVFAATTDGVKSRW